VDHCGICTHDADEPRRRPLAYSGHCCGVDIWFLVHVNLCVHDLVVQNGVVQNLVQNLVVRNLVRNLVAQAQGRSSDDRCSPSV